MNKSKSIKNILITGGAGFIGSKLSTELVNLGFNVTVIDLLKYDKSSLNHLFFYKNFNFVYGDVRDKKLMKKIIKNMDFIIPLAALVGAPLCEKYKRIAQETNFKAIQLLLKSIKKKQKIIYLNSNSGYGIGEKNKYCDETSPLNPVSLYGKTKVEAEKIVIKHENSVTFRLATVFGCSYRMRSDLIVNNFVLKAVKDKKIEIFEPHFRRNFVHINDIVSLIVFTIKNFNKLKGKTFNFGNSNENITKYNLAKKIKKQIKNLKIKLIKGIKDPDKRDYFVSNSKIEKAGFAAKISLDQGINEMKRTFEINQTKIINNY
tara:strand:+ start:6696 stop:7649 length:954 start_codon:yes stop_codon:yes gene_type:complete